jgi:hypothetical protein
MLLNGAIRDEETLVWALSFYNNNCLIPDIQKGPQMPRNVVGIKADARFILGLMYIRCIKGVASGKG